ncbi:hypothetical protein BOTBODRAFT_190283 [Botryobasidium botryosum FD-172 SS1]|uniref:Magnesium-dependent phosphatase-1 n=1 Tax=Botryobasidium botryosum (strain FD-172 SS1) TaxID=930990 RepID=A0A067M519_BOTB1|nr:hypothetical protein BOTBODRAFT_190283 [Botryobasidium botryosum FD-172 SS1]
MTPSLAFPQLIAFDLDYTLWDLWIDTHAVSPLRREQQAINCIADRYGSQIKFYPDVPEILHSLVKTGVHVAVCSRTTTPDLHVPAREALSLLLLPAKPQKTLLDHFSHSSSKSKAAAEAEEGASSSSASEPIPARDFFDTMEIYPFFRSAAVEGSKLVHFKALHEKTGIPYDQMLFFDDEIRNKEVEKLGVTFILVRRGVDHDCYQKGLQEWRRKRSGASASGSKTRR